MTGVGYRRLDRAHRRLKTDSGRRAFVDEHGTPGLRLPVRARLVARPIGTQAGRDNPGLAQAMIENHEAVVKTHVAIGQFQIVYGAARELRLDEILEVITPIAKAAAEREREINLIEQLVARH